MNGVTPFASGFPLWMEGSPIESHRGDVTSKRRAAAQHTAQQPEGVQHCGVTSRNNHAKDARWIGGVSQSPGCDEAAAHHGDDAGELAQLRTGAKTSLPLPSPPPQNLESAAGCGCGCGCGYGRFQNLHAVIALSPPSLEAPKGGCLGRSGQAGKRAASKGPMLLQDPKRAQKGARLEEEGRNFSLLRYMKHHPASGGPPGALFLPIASLSHLLPEELDVPEGGDAMGSGRWRGEGRGGEDEDEGPDHRCRLLDAHGLRLSAASSLTPRPATLS